MNRRELLKAGMALPFAGVVGAQVADGSLTMTELNDLAQSYSMDKSFEEIHFEYLRRQLRGVEHDDRVFVLASPSAFEWFMQQERDIRHPLNSVWSSCCCSSAIEHKDTCPVFWDMRRGQLIPVYQAAWAKQWWMTMYEITSSDSVRPRGCT